MSTPAAPALLDTHEVQTGPAPATSLIVLHGLGADGFDFVPICDELDLSSLGDIRFVFPHAPVRPVTLNGGHAMRAWYDIRGTQIDRQEDEAGLRASVTAVRALIARERDRGVAAKRIVLMGFSQGCAMTLLTGLRHDETLAGLVGLSGYLPLAATTAVERHPANAQTPIFLTHGRSDTVIPIDRAIASRDALLALGQPVQWHEYPMGHSVCLEEIRDLQAWLLQRLA